MIIGFRVKILEETLREIKNKNIKIFNDKIW